MKKPDGPRVLLQDWRATPVWRLAPMGIRLVLDKMSGFGNASGVVFPSVATLAALCGVSEATVERAQKYGVAVGILLRGEQVRRKGQQGPGSVEYRFQPRPASPEALAEAVRVARALRGGEGRRRLPRWRISRHLAGDSRDPVTGRFRGESPATAPAISRHLAGRPSTHRAKNPEGKDRTPEESSQAAGVGTGVPRPLRSPSEPGWSRGTAAREEARGPAAVRVPEDRIPTGQGSSAPASTKNLQTMYRISAVVGQVMAAVPFAVVEAPTGSGGEVNTWRA